MHHRNWVRVPWERWHWVIAASATALRGHLSTWLRGELPACFGLLGRIDALWPDVSSRQMSSFV